MGATMTTLAWQDFDDPDPIAHAAELAAFKLVQHTEMDRGDFEALYFYSQYRLTEIDVDRNGSQQQALF